MRIYIADQDENSCRALREIIQQNNIGEICGVSHNAEDAFADLIGLKPDLLMVDLLEGTERKGIALLEMAKQSLPEMQVIFFSQCRSEPVISEAYQKKANLFLRKPLIASELKTILAETAALLGMRDTIQKAKELFSAKAAFSSGFVYAETSYASASQKTDGAYLRRLHGILQGLGISSESGTKDIISVIEYLMDRDMEITETTLNELCSHLGDNPKSVEQRIRRAAFAGMVNLANKGLEDYADPVFNEYAGRLYNFEQIRREMNYIRGKSEKHGNVRIRNFLNGLLAYCKEN